ncbi:GMC family oxidoreductase [Xinfangfangia sp. CPCC 101601]|uniref:GMC family oxidoreductase n=1 Tax=Pseudogemmobacter lacusdianii TaxID=3069608 RepID=A0ABU0VTA6_9RHOB|nr:GMC family oxidoreductase [Xinfangfangia sp. CPCC 101601]MDQ2064954.1 GMC family oxidoreductase [Xinfangfangia sp. CPCC 101601]
MQPDILIIGSGMGGATLAAALAPSGRRIVILERGARLMDRPEARDPDAIFRRGFFKPKELWKDASGQEFEPGNYACVGGNSKFYGAVLTRYRAEDFAPLQHMGGRTPGWPIGYADLEPYYSKAEQLYRVRGEDGANDPSEPPHSARYPYPPVPDEPDVAALRKALAAQGLHPTALPVGVDIEAWLKRAPTTWDAFPCTTGAKSDAESCGLAEALKYPNVTLLTETRVVRVLSEGRRVTGVEVERQRKREVMSAPVICLCAGAVMSAALLLASANAEHPQGLANSSDQLGRNFMNHNLTGVVAWNPLRRNRTIYEKTIQFNDWYLTGGPGGAPLGNVQMLGRVTGMILAGESGLPLWAARHIADHSMHLLAMSEDLPDPNSRVLWRDGVVLDWRRTNVQAHDILVKKLKAALRKAGWPIVFAQAFPKSKPSHQCGTARMGRDPAQSVVDPNLKAHDFDNLYIVDASVLPTSAAVNPSLTIAALATRAGAHIRSLP